MDPVLSIEYIRAWAKARLSGGKLTDFNRELPNNAFCRTIGIDPAFFAKIVAGVDPMPARYQRLLSRFIRDWENGLLYFTPSKIVGAGPGKLRGRTKREVRRVTEKPKPKTRFAIEFKGGPKVAIIGRPPPNPTTPNILELMARLRSK